MSKRTPGHQLQINIVLWNGHSKFWSTSLYLWPFTVLLSYEWSLCMHRIAVLMDVSVTGMQWKEKLCGKPLQQNLWASFIVVSLANWGINKIHNDLIALYRLFSMRLKTKIKFLWDEWPNSTMVKIQTTKQKAPQCSN